MILVINKIDRSDARIKQVIDEVYELFLDLDANEHQIEFPIVYTNARTGTATLDLAQPGENLVPLFETLLEHIPAPEYEEDHPLQALVTNLDASPYVGRLALCRMRHGTLRKAQNVAWCRVDGTIENVKVTELYVTEALDRVPAEEVGPGEIIAIAGLAGRDDRRDAGRPRGPAPAARHPRRRAEPLDDDRHQHIAAVRSRRLRS